MVMFGAQWNEDKMPKYALTNDALDLGWKKTRLERQSGERSEKFGQTMSRQMPLHSTLYHLFKPRKSNGMMGVLLKQRRDKSRSIKTDFHDSKSTNLSAAMFSLLFQKCPDVPSRLRNLTGTNKNPAFLSKRRCRSRRAQTNTIRLNGDFHVVARLQRKTIPDGLGHHNPTHAIKRN